MATQDKSLAKGLVNEDKKVRVFNFHKNTFESFMELLCASGIDHPDKINRTHVYRRVFMNLVKTYEEIYPSLSEGCLLKNGDAPEHFKGYLSRSSVESFEVGS